MKNIYIIFFKLIYLERKRESRGGAEREGERVRGRESKREGERERERERESQEGFTPSTQSPMWGSNPQTRR